MSWSRPIALLLAVLTTSCGEATEEDSTGRVPKTVPDGAFALVGSEVLSLNLLSQVEKGRHSEFAEAVVHDALLSSEARDSIPYLSTAAERGVLGRALLEELERVHLEEKPVSEEERRRNREKNWMLFDRPRAVRVVEVFTPLSAIEDDTFAYAEMSRLRKQSVEAGNLKGLIAALSGVETDLKYRTTRLPPITNSGKVVPFLPQDHRYSEVPPELGQAAGILSHAGDVSEVFPSGAGLHFLFAVEVVPELRPSEEEVREELLKGIAAARLTPELKKIRANRKIQVRRAERDLGALTRLAWRRK